MMPAGTYFIGDLSHVMHHEWEEVCHKTIVGELCLQGEFALEDKRQFAIFNTLYGHGTYMCTNGKALTTDSGTIGCIRVQDISDKTLVLDELLEHHGMVVEFAEPFVTTNHMGLIAFGHVGIDTDMEVANV